LVAVGGRVGVRAAEPRLPLLLIVFRRRLPIPV